MIKNFILILFFAILTMSNNISSVDAMRLKGDDVDKLYLHISYDYSEPTEKIFDNKLRVSSKNLLVCNSREYGFEADKYGSNYYYFKTGFEGVPNILAVCGICLDIQNLTDDVCVIKWNESLLQLGTFSGIPFLPGMKYVDAGNPSVTPSSIIPPHSTISINLYLSNPEFVSGNWKDGCSFVLVDNSLKGSIYMKTEFNGESKYYGFITPRIMLPQRYVEEYRYRK